ncbi:unnamed protein product [Lathyrus oleraceus]
MYTIPMWFRLRCRIQNVDHEKRIGASEYDRSTSKASPFIGERQQHEEGKSVTRRSPPNATNSKVALRRFPLGGTEKFTVGSLNIAASWTAASYEADDSSPKFISLLSLLRSYLLFILDNIQLNMVKRTLWQI